MDSLERLQGDLSFVRGALDASTRAPSPSALYFLWAVVVLVGFVLVDFRPAWVAEYWTVAGPAGFFASAYLGWRHARQTGQASVSDGSRHLLHWGGVLVAVALAVLLGVSRAMPSGSLHTVILLVLSLGYFTAGLHLDRRLLWVGLLMGVGSVFVTMVSLYAWTMVGIALAVSLMVAGMWEGRSREATT
ncbi:MAG TPA: hypothetical protein VH701_06955 [Vicinamibacterales bacterium]|jgi:hypothetical protein